MSFASDGRGRPTKEQEHLYLSAVTFAYAVWESYAEDVAIELVKILAPSLPSDSIPPQVTQALADKDAWQLAVHPGWRDLWIKEVENAAKGGEGAGYGINTASFKNIRGRSEEHTSELQSRGHLVCRLLLEKKKKYMKVE